MKRKKEPTKNTKPAPKAERMAFVGLRLPPEWIDAVKQLCVDAGFPGSHPTILRRALQAGLKTMGIEVSPRRPPSPPT